MSSVAPMESSSSAVMCGVTMVTSSLTSTSTSMPCELISPTSEGFPRYNTIINSEVPKEKNEDTINLDAPRRRDKSTGDQEMVTVKKVGTGFVLQPITM